LDRLTKPIPIFPTQRMLPFQITLAGRLFMQYPVTQDQACEYVLRSATTYQAEQACQLRRNGATHAQALAFCDSPALNPKPIRPRRIL
jgi:hypothetical protein